jgi:MraZ protein
MEDKFDDASKLLRGNSIAKVDIKGRLKIPSSFRQCIEKRWGREVFVTSLSSAGEYIRIYPLPVWEKLEEKLGKISSIRPQWERLMNVVNFFGQVGMVDNQGRILLHPLLREKATATAEVTVLGKRDHLDVWNIDRFMKKLEKESLTDEDLNRLADLGLESL